MLKVAIFQYAAAYQAQDTKELPKTIFSCQAEPGFPVSTPKGDQGIIRSFINDLPTLKQNHLLQNSYDKYYTPETIEKKLISTSFSVKINSWSGARQSLLPGFPQLWRDGSCRLSDQYNLPAHLPMPSRRGH